MTATVARLMPNADAKKTKEIAAQLRERNRDKKKSRWPTSYLWGIARVPRIVRQRAA